MHVGHLLESAELDLGLVCGEGARLRREISGVTATDLENPARFLLPAELVLTGLVWWTPEDGEAKAARFVDALCSAEAVALLAGEETHGGVPTALVDACRARGLPLLSVPAHTSFRTVTDAVYLRRWSELSAQTPARDTLSPAVRGELDLLLERGAPLDELLRCAFAALGEVRCAVVTATGRTLARTGATGRGTPGSDGSGGAKVPVGGGSSPYDAWSLRLPDAEALPPRLVREVAEQVARWRAAEWDRTAQQRAAGAELAELLTGPYGERGGARKRAEALLAEAGLADRPLRVVSVRLGAGAAEAATEEWATAALREALALLDRGPYLVGPRPDGGALAVLADDEAGRGGDDSCQPADALREWWPRVQRCRPRVGLHAGIGGPATVGRLPGSLAQADFARDTTVGLRPDTGPVAVEELDRVRSLVRGLPPAVREAFSAQVLGPLLRTGPRGGTRTGAGAEGQVPMLVETLEAFLHHDGSWSRTAQALHLHVNTVHYRVQRIEQLTGRDLARLEHRLDLHTALLCRAAPNSPAARGD